MSLVKGIQTPFKAVAVSVKEGGKVEAIEVGGKVATRGDGVTSLEVEGRIGRLVVSGGISATGRRSDAVHASTELPGLDQIEVSAADGRTLVRET